MKWKIWTKWSTPKIPKRAPKKSINKPGNKISGLIKRKRKKADSVPLSGFAKIIIIFFALLAAVMLLFGLVVGDGLTLGFTGIIAAISLIAAFMIWRKRSSLTEFPDSLAGLFGMKNRFYDQDSGGRRNFGALPEESAAAKAARELEEQEAIKRRLHARVLPELLEAGESEISAEEDCSDPDKRKELFEELKFEYEMLHGKTLEQDERYESSDSNTRLGRKKGDYLGRTIKVVK